MCRPCTVSRGGDLRLLLIGSMISAGAAILTRHNSRELGHYTFSHFVKEFGRTYEQGTDEWAKREDIFESRMQEVHSFRRGPPRSWTKGVTKFMDYTDAEYKALLGYRGRRGAASSHGTGYIELFNHRERMPVLPSFIDVGSNRSMGALIRDQGSCGSCWAEAATSVMESHMENNKEVLAAMSKEVSSVQKFPTLSSQAVVSCTENPRHCGGKGGCEGATAELAFAMVQERGLPLAVKWGYSSGSGNSLACKNEVFNNLKLGIAGYEVLPSNKMSPLKRALVDSGGPIVVSVDATNWAFYAGGVFSDTDGGKPGDFTVNHAVVLMGFQETTQNQQGYWLIKNSWGGYWGEQGFIRLEMKANEEEHCGTDYATHDGLACDGDPDTAWVCGTCGVLYDSSYPTGLFIMHSDSR